MNQNEPLRLLDAPEKADCYDGGMLLLASDCAVKAYNAVYEGFHKDKITFLYCANADAQDYSAKLTAILKNNDVRRVTILRLEASCCDAIEKAMVNAITDANSIVPWHAVTLPVNDEVKAICPAI